MAFMIMVIFPRNTIILVYAASGSKATSTSARNNITNPAFNIEISGSMSCLSLFASAFIIPLDKRFIDFHYCGLILSPRT